MSQRHHRRMHDPRKRSEKITNIIDDNYSGYVIDPTQTIIEQIAAQIREADKEALDKFIEANLRTNDEAYQTGRASMREEAAKVVENAHNHFGYCECEKISKRIRAIAVEEK